ncbi:MAG: small multi-drug export protein, partial [Clostridia bacterium]|nr:small multi-drug export protein [Clostridia bacterium]
MKESIVEFLSSLTGNPRVTVILFSMFPLVELKGAIPVGEALGLGLWRSALLSYIGSTLIAVPVFFLLKPVFALMKKWKFIAGLVEKTENVFRRRAEKLAEKTDGNAGRRERVMLMVGV